MLGKLSSVGIIVERLKRAGCRNWAVTEFLQGTKTRRWGVAWSWRGLRPAVGVARGIRARALKVGTATAEGDENQGGSTTNNSSEQDHDEELEGGGGGGLLPFPSEFEFQLPLQRPATKDKLKAVGNTINAEISNLLPDLRWQWKPTLGIGLGIAPDGDCWSRKARRRKEHDDAAAKLKRVRKLDGEGDEDMRDSDSDSDEEGDEEGDEEKEPELVFKIHVRIEPETEREGEEGQAQKEGRKRAEAEAGVVIVTVRWLQGHDHVLFESFCGWLKRRLASSTR